jgi:RNA polymerase sigma factor (TIGR02999 family)
MNRPENEQHEEEFSYGQEIELRFPEGQWRWCYTRGTYSAQINIRGSEMRTPASTEVTQLLFAWSAGDERALEELLPVVYRELHRMARHYMASERPDHTLQASALLNEAYLKLVDVRQMQWKDRAHFFGVTAQLMRRILVDFGRRRHYQKRGDGVRPVTLNDDLMISAAQTTNLVALDDALNALGAVDPRRVRVVELRFFAGLSVEETAEVLKVSVNTVARDWKLAKVWLHRELKKAGAA